LKEHNGKWLLHFENEIAVSADFVIGANGGMSKVRKYITDAEIEYTGTLILQGEVFQPEMACPEIYQLCNDNILMAASKGNLLVANPRNGGILSYGVMFRKPEEWDQENGFNVQDTDGMIRFLLNR